MKKVLLLFLKFIFEVNWPDPTQPDLSWHGLACPTVTLFGVLFLSQMGIIFFLTQCGYRFRIVVSSFKMNFLLVFEIRAFLLKSVFCLFSYTFEYNSGTT